LYVSQAITTGGLLLKGFMKKKKVKV